MVKRIYYDLQTGKWLIVKDAQKNIVENIQYIDVDDADLDDAILFHVEDGKLMIDQTASSIK